MTLKEMHIEYLAPEALTPYAKNAKEHTDKQVEQIANSIRELGFRQPLVVDRDGVVIIGHGRLLAAKRMGLERVPCVRADDLNEAQARALRLADNKLNESAWIEPLRDEELAALAEEIDMSQFGFDDVLEEMAEAVDVVEDEPPELPEEPRARLGDVYRLGEHRLMCGDSTDAEAVQALMDGEVADLMVTDPPYNINLTGGGIDDEKRRVCHGIQNDAFDKMEDYEKFLTKAIVAGNTALRNGAAFYVWYASKCHTANESAIQRAGLEAHQQLIWVKTQAILGRNDYHWQHECCLYGWKSGAAHYFTDSRAESTVIEDEGVKLSTLKKGELIELCEKLLGQHKAGTVLRADKPTAAEMHPTVKPQALLAPLIRNSSKPGWKVLDLFGGSGSTLIACEQLGRRCFMMELDPRYVDVIVDRWEKFTGRKAEKLK